MGESKRERRLAFLQRGRRFMFIESVVLLVESVGVSLTVNARWWPLALVLVACWAVTLWCLIATAYLYRLLRKQLDD